MTALEEFRRDAVKVALSSSVQPILKILLLFALGFGLVCYGERRERGRASIAAAVDTVRITTVRYEKAKEGAEAAKRESDLAQAKSDESDAAVVIVNETTLQLAATPTAPPQTIVVPAPVVKDIADLRATVAAQRRTIDSLFHVVSLADSTIHARDKLIAKLKPPRRCGLGVSLGYGLQAVDSNRVRRGWSALVGPQCRLF